MHLLTFVAAFLLAAPVAAQVVAPTAARARFCADERMPELIGGLASLQPVYPKPERSAGIEGRVFLQFVVRGDGSVSGVTVTRGVSPALDSSAAGALRRVRFVPGTRCGEPVDVRFSLPVNFRLAEHREKVARYPTADLPLRAEPAPEAAVLVRIPPGTRLVTRASGYGWCVVRYEGQVGYVLDTALAYAPPPGAPKH